MTDDVVLLRELANTIRHLRRVNDVLQAQVDVVDTFRAALQAEPGRAGGMSPDIVWTADKRIEEMLLQRPKPEAKVAAHKGEDDD